MRNRYLELATTPAVRAARLRWDGVDRYAPAGGPTTNDWLGPAESAFITARDGFYLSSVSEDGWPYVQFRGGPRGFLRVLDERTLAFTDLGGNRQYLTVGNTAADDRVALMLMDYRHRRRLKLLGRLQVVEDRELLASLAVPGSTGRPERAMRIAVEAFDWNCPQHVPVRFDREEVDALHERIAVLEAENARLRAG